MIAFFLDEERIELSPPFKNFRPQLQNLRYEPQKGSTFKNELY